MPRASPRSSAAENLRAAAGKPGPRKGKSYNGTHWKQIAKAEQDGIQIAAPVKKRHYSGVHWTRRPENRARALRVAKNAARVSAAKRKSTAK
jgi:hypothetical protein